MRVFVAGASGAIGTHLVPQLIGAGHTVIGTARSRQRADQIRAQGAEAVTLDLLDARAVRDAVLQAAPDAVVHQATAIADARFGRSLDKIEPIRKRMFPIVGDGGGYMSFVHLDDAAAATVLALAHDTPGVYNIVDDEPAPIRDWLPVLADAVGAKAPRRFPRWLATIIAGEGNVINATEARGASNGKAKRELGWTPRYPTWRQGFAAAYRDQPPNRSAAAAAISSGERSRMC